MGFNTLIVGRLRKYAFCPSRIAGGLAMAALLVLCACGQRGDLYLPKEPEAAGRATLPQVLLPGNSGAGSSVPAAPTASIPSPAPATSAAR